MRILHKVADGIILKYGYEYPDAYVEDFDSMDFDQVVQYFENEQFPRFKFHIELSDEVFGLQLAGVTKSSVPISLSFVGTDIVPWEQPILWANYQDVVDKSGK